MHFETLPIRPTFSRNARPIVPRISAQTVTPRSSGATVHPCLMYADAEEDDASDREGSLTTSPTESCDKVKAVKFGDTLPERAQLQRLHYSTLQTIPRPHPAPDDTTSTLHAFPSSSMSFASSCTSCTSTHTAASPLLKLHALQTPACTHAGVRSPSAASGDRVFYWMPHESAARGTIRDDGGMVTAVISFRRSFLRPAADIEMKCGSSTRVNVAPTLAGWRVVAASQRQGRARKWPDLAVASVAKVHNGTCITIAAESFTVRAVGIRFAVVKDDENDGNVRGKCRHTSLDGLYSSHRRRLRNSSLDGSSSLSISRSAVGDAAIATVVPIRRFDKVSHNTPFRITIQRDVPDVLPPLVMWAVLATMRKSRFFVNSSYDGSWGRGWLFPKRYLYCQPNKVGKLS